MIAAAARIKYFFIFILFLIINCFVVIRYSAVPVVFPPAVQLEIVVVLPEALLIPTEGFIPPVLLKVQPLIVAVL